MKQYIYQPYPRWKYHWSGKTVVVQNAEEEAALGGGWANSPTAFDVYKSPRTNPTKRADPTKWVDDWCPADLTIGLRQKVKAELLKAHGAFWKSPDTAAADINSMRLAFDGIATVLFDGGLLTEELLAKGIPALVWDSAIAGEWWRLAVETRNETFPEPLGHYWVWRDDSRDWDMVFGSETAGWQARLLAVAADLTPQEKNRQSGGRKKRGRPSRFSPELKQRALAAKVKNGNRAAACILYDTKYPKPQEVKNVSAILRYFQRSSPLSSADE